VSEEYTIGIGHAETGGVQLQSKVCASLRVSAESIFDGQCIGALR